MEYDLFFVVPQVRDHFPLTLCVSELKPFCQAGAQETKELEDSSPQKLLFSFIHFLFLMLGMCRVDKFSPEVKYLINGG